MRHSNPLNTFFLIPIYLLCVHNANAQLPSIDWQKMYWSSKDEVIYNMIQLKDGHYLYCGQSSSTNGDFSDPGKFDAFLLKADKMGNVLWSKKYGGSRQDVFYNMTELDNGDIIAIGTTSSNNHDVQGNHGPPGTEDVWLIKTTKAGILTKQKCFGGSHSEATYDLGENQGLFIDPQGNILFTAQTSSNDGDVSNNHGDYDGWVVKLTPSFEIVWEKTIGDASYDAMYTILDINGHFLVTGTKATKKFSDPVFLEDYFKAHAAKLDYNGNIIWYRVYGGSGSDDCNASVVSADGMLVLTGHTSSTDGDVVGNVGFNTWTWKIDIDKEGEILWQNFTGIPGDTAAAFNIAATQDGGFVAMGVVGHPWELFDAYALKINDKGITQWTKRFGGSKFDGIQCGMEINNGNILMGGLTSSNDGDVSGKHKGPGDAWMVEMKLE